MYCSSRKTHWRRRVAACAGVVSLLATTPPGALAQASPQIEVYSLRQAYEAAWARQPESLALAHRRDAARAQAQAARSWTAEPPSLGLLNKTDRLNEDQGTREFEVGVALPIWLPGERGRTQDLAEAEGRAVESRASAAQLRVAAAVREAWWQWQRARVEAETARGQLDNSRQIAADVARRVKAGDLARADQHQADGAVAAAEAVLAQTQAGVVATEQTLRAITAATRVAAEPWQTGLVSGTEPEPIDSSAEIDTHGEIRSLQDRVAAAEQAAALAAVRSRANPELILATTSERGASGEAYRQTVTLGVRIPFGGGPRHEFRMAAARAEAAELRAQLALQQERLSSDREAARVRVDSARIQLEAAVRRARLAREARGFFEKSFQLGETDLPTRLRIEAEAAEAERQAARSRVELAAAISAWRQALGLLPQ